MHNVVTMYSLPVSAHPIFQASRQTIWGAAACGAIAVPVLVVPILPPVTSFLTQVLALFGWGALLAVMAGALPARAIPWHTDTKALHGALLVLLVATLAAPLWTGQPVSLALCAAGMIVAAALAAMCGAALRQTGSGERAFRALCIGVAVAATLNAAVAVIQLYAPAWPDGYWISPALPGGRAIGNLRQSNHLCTLSLWGIVSIIWLGETGLLRRTTVVVLALLLMFSAVLTGSRTGLVGVLVLPIWGLLDRRLAVYTRITLWLAPVAYALLWAGATASASTGSMAFAGETRFTLVDVRLSTRLDIWPNTLALIREHPWFGVGVGEFNLAWTLTPFPVRSGELFNNAHNLPLQLAVELGLPLAVLVMALFAWAFCGAARNCRDSAVSGEAASPVRPAFVMLTLVLLHSLMEYPLWFAHFLLPTMFMLGLCLPRLSQYLGVATPESQPDARATSNLRPAALILMLGAAFSVQDYLRLLPIFVPPPPSVPSPFSERIAAGQRSLLFPYMADFVAAVQPVYSEASLSAAKRALHNLIDAPLMIAYANALHALGDTERARYVAQRVNEFPSEQRASYFAACNDTTQTDLRRPYQCFAPQRKFTFEDFR